MSVILTNNPSDLGNLRVAQHTECACDCNCACPTDGNAIPDLELPVAYYLELTPVCNNRCPGCGNIYAERRSAIPAPLDGANWQTLIAHLAQHAHQFKITGGEPTLHPQFADIVATVNTLGIPFALFTAGRWADPDSLIQLLRATPMCEGMLISLHGPDADTHESFSNVPGSFDETVANIRRAIDAGIAVSTSFVINAYNWNRVEEALHLALSLGVNHVVCNRLIGDSVPGLTPDNKQLRAAIHTIESLREAGHPIRFGNCIPQCFAPSSSTGCTAGSTFATIDPWGRMRPCNHTPIIAGDLKTQSVESVWNGEVMQQWRGLVPEGCATCAAFALCHGGCRAQALLTGQKQDPLIRQPISALTMQETDTLKLYAGLRPMGQFTQRTDGTNELLIHRSQVVVIPQDYGPLAGQLKGDFTLENIKNIYGAYALEWIGELYQQGLVMWA